MFQCETNMLPEVSKITCASKGEYGASSTLHLASLVVGGGRASGASSTLHLAELVASHRRCKRLSRRKSTHGRRRSQNKRLSKPSVPSRLPIRGVRWVIRAISNIESIGLLSRVVKRASYPSWDIIEQGGTSQRRYTGSVHSIIGEWHR